MKTTYVVFAWLIAALVMAQAATEAWFATGAGKFLSEGGTLDLEQTSGPVPFVEVYGIVWHGLAGMYVIPFLALVLIVIGYLSRNRRALYYALAVAALVVIQVTLGLTASGITFLAFLHGANALLLFGVAITAAMSVQRTPRVPPRVHPTEEPRPTVGTGV